MAEQWTVKSVNGVEPESAKEQEQAVVEEAVAETPNVEIQEDNTVVKVDLDNPPEPKQEEDVVQETKEEPTPEATEEPEAEPSPIEIVNEEEAPIEKVEEPVAIHQPEPTPVPEQPKLPENVQKLIDFMDETGGTVEDYANLNKDISKLDDVSVVKEYYKTKYPNLDDEDITFKMNDQFLFDEEADEERAIRSKKLAFKEELYNARTYLEARKSKYYDELKLNRQNSIPEEYQQAYETAQSYNKAQESNKQLQATFQQKTDAVFNELKGFDFKVGDNTYRYKVNEPAKVKEYQSDINNFVGEFLTEDGSIGDAKGYHKALFAAKNADKIAQHFYEQGRADAIKQEAKDAKNIDMNPRADHSASVTTKSGTKVRVVDDGFNGKLRFKNYNNR